MKKAQNFMPNATRGRLRTVIGPIKPLTPAEKQRRLRDREKWLSGIDLLEAFNDLFDYMPEYRVFLKRRAGEIMFLSRAMVRTLRAPDEASVICASDHDVTPGPLAELYHRRDEVVLSTGQTLTGLLEVWFTLEGLPQWFVCHKAPLRDRQGRIVGIIGFLKDYPDFRPLSMGDPLDQLVRFINENLSSPLQIGDLAEMAHLSVRQVERLFRSAFGMKPKDYIIKTRVHKAVELLVHTDLPINRIALEVGLCDQSALTYYFRRELGVTPQKFRKAALLWRYSLRTQPEDTAMPD